MSSHIRLTEEIAEETLRDSVRWDRGAFKFLLSRSLNAYNRKKNSARRKLVSDSLDMVLPLLDDELMLSLYNIVSIIDRVRCLTGYENSGYTIHPPERKFLSTLEYAIDALEFRDRVEVYPSWRLSHDVDPGLRVPVGVYVPDFLVFGLRCQGSKSLAFEIDGNVHTAKYQKDEDTENKLQSLGVHTIRIPNHQVRDWAYIGNVIRVLAQENSPLSKDQLLRHKREIWAKTIACQVTLKDLDYLANKFLGRQLNLVAEARELVALSSCPREIKKELTPVDPFLMSPRVLWMDDKVESLIQKYLRRSQLRIKKI